jgi:heat shock protein HslJ
MIKNNTLLGFLFTTSILFAGCGDGVEPLTGPSSVIGGAWKLQSLETPAGGLVTVARPENYTVEFRDAGALAVKADCNSCNGSYSISGSSLTISALACTRAFCGAASLDTPFLTVLTNATTFGVLGLDLTIDSPKGSARLNR